jgi:hypothetical protein
MAEGEVFQIYNGLNASNTPFLFLRFRKYSGSYQIQLGTRTNNDVNIYAAWRNVSNAPHFVEIEWASASPGLARLWLDGTQVGSLSASNSKWKLRSSRIGAVAGVKANTRGMMYFDEFEARTKTYIGAAAGSVVTQPTPLPSPTAAPVATKTPATNPTAAPTQTPTSKPADQLFADSFESGSLSSWTSSLTDAGNLSVSTAAALVGSRGMQALINDNNALYVHTTLPASQSRYRMRFYFHPNSVQMAEGDMFNIYNAYNSAGSTNLMIRMRRYLGNYQLQVAARDNSTWVMTGWYTITNAKQYIEIDWKSATSASYNNGFLYFYLNGSVKTSLALYNSSWTIARDRLGAVEGIRTGTRGTIYFDHFESRKSTYIGP